MQPFAPKLWQCRLSEFVNQVDFENFVRTINFVNMSKKKFIDGDVFSAMTNSAGNAPQAAPFETRMPEPPPPPRRSTEQGLSDGMTRATIIVSKSLIEKCKDIAYWDRLRDQDVYAAALNAFITEHEKRTGRQIDPRPAHARRVLVRETKTEI